MHAPSFTSWRMNASVVALLLPAAAAFSQTQPQAQQNAAPNSRPTLTIPGTNELLQLQVLAPAEVRVGDSYEYQIRVTNVSSDVMVHQVTVQQQSQDGFQIEQASLESTGQDGAPSDSGNDDTRNADSEAADREDQPQRVQSASRQSSGETENANEWTIERLRPGETRTIRVSASSDEEGVSGACIEIVSYHPALCLQTTFVKPELELVKTAPDAVGLCEPIEFAYYIKNDGSGDTGRLTIHDKLEDGLVTASGDEELSFDVDNLAPGDTRKFVAQIRAQKPGKYSSRATVEAENGGEARSRSAPTEVLNAELALELSGPDMEYHGRPLSFLARVTNVGDAPAPEVRLAVYGEQGVRLVRAGDPRPSQNHVESNSSGGPRPSPEVLQASATAESSEPNVQQAADVTGDGRGAQRASQELEVWDLGTIAPGETREVRYTVQPGGSERILQRAVAQYVCARAEDERQVVESVALAETEVISLPALLIAVIDEVDPVKVGDDVVYRIVVENQGTAPDEQIQLVAELPEALEFRSIEGQTSGRHEGRQVAFETLDRLGPGERATWTLRARVTEPGEVVLKVDLTSKNQDEEVRSEEPTRLFGEEG